MEGVGEEVVAQQDGGLVAPLGVDRGGVAADQCLVEDVVVDERGRVDHLDDRRQDRVRGGERAARLAGKQQKRRPQPLAAEVGGVIDELLHEREPAPQLGREDPLGLGQLGGDRRIDRRELLPRFLGLQQYW